MNYKNRGWASIVDSDELSRDGYRHHASLHLVANWIQNLTQGLVDYVYLSKLQLSSLHFRNEQQIRSAGDVSNDYEVI